MAYAQNKKGLFLNKTHDTRDCIPQVKRENSRSYSLCSRY